MWIWGRRVSQRLDQTAVIAGGVDQIVEAEVEFRRLLLGDSPLGIRRHRVDHCLQLRQVRGSRELGRPPRRQRLDRHPQRVDLLQVLGRELRHERAPVAPDHDQTLALQPDQRLAHGSPADAHRAGDRLLAQLLPRAEVPGQDGIAQADGDIDRQRPALRHRQNRL